MPPGRAEMDREKYLVRPFSERDYEAASRIGNMVNPEFRTTAEEDRHWEDAFLASNLVNEKWVVAERSGGKVIAYASLNHSPFSFHPQKFWAGIVVDPAHRGRGIGRALAALAEEETARHRAICLWTNVRKDDGRSLEFARRHGFEELRRLWVSRLDLSQPRPIPAEDRRSTRSWEGIRFSTLAEDGSEREEVRRRVFDLLSEASRDVPRMGEFTPISFEQFVGEFSGPGFLPETWFLASEGEKYVAMSNLERNLADLRGLRVGFTGTRSTHRGRGLASELKRRALQHARQRGAEYLLTVNDSLNLPMWAINEKQGFRVVVEWVCAERQISVSVEGERSVTGG